MKLNRKDKMSLWRFAQFVLILLVLFTIPVSGFCVGDQSDSNHDHTDSATSDSPNILFIIMDDVGIDQMQVFGYGGATPPATPNIDQLAQSGIRFHNTWAMPTCSTSRSVFFTGRMPVRTNVYGALGPNDLANSMVSPYEMTAPKLLKKKGYRSALFGKFHLALQANNAAGLAMPRDLGWDYFSGWLDETGDPSSIDTSAGGVSPEGAWSCGFVPDEKHGGADFGACYTGNGACGELSKTGSNAPAPGRLCRDQGGVFDPGKSCQSPRPDYVDFSILNGHYVSPLVINHEHGDVEQVPPEDPRSRRYRAQAVVDDAIDWIGKHDSGEPWMATVSFASVHTPVMQPPADELQTGNDLVENLDCGNLVAQRALTNLMIESMDTEVGRLLADTGVATRAANGALIYDPMQSDTMVIVVGDNGTLGSVVKLPFDASRAKGTAYQTGVWVPLIVAGPLVNSPDRIVSSMVNVADLFALFGEIAGIDAHKAVPRPIDSVAMLPYLTKPDQASLRSTNFTQVGPNLQANNGVNGPCVIQTACTQIPPSKGVCEDNNGVWWGEGADDPVTEGIPASGLPRCCDVNAFRAAQGQDTYTIVPDFSTAIRNNLYKIVQNTTWIYNEQNDLCEIDLVTEFFNIDENVPVPTLDTDGTQIDVSALPPDSEEKINYDSLMLELEQMLSLTPNCPGDGNIDSRVNSEDISGWHYYAHTWGLSSVFDFNLDGLTDGADRLVIATNRKMLCRSGANYKPEDHSAQSPAKAHHR